MRKGMCLVLALVLCVGLCACAESKADPRVTYDPVNIGDYKIAFDGAQVYTPGDTDYLLFYYNFTNNSKEAVKPCTKVVVQATVNDEPVRSIAFLKNQQPPEYNNHERMLEPGETIRCVAPLQGLKNGGGTYEIIVMDLYHEQEEQLVITFDSMNLPIVVKK